MAAFPVPVIVGIEPEGDFYERRSLFTLLEQIFPVRFQVGIPDDCIALLMFGCPSDGKIPERARCLPIFYVRQDSEGSNITPKTLKVNDYPPGQPYLKGISFEVRNKLTFGSVQPAVGERVIMEADGLPVWTEATSPTNQRMTATGALPNLPENRAAVLRLIENRWLQVIPLLDFLVTVTAPYDWDRQPSRACLMFDDPNLHFTRFGYIDFRKLAEHAGAHHYHASMAMVPLDTWYTSRHAAQIFRENSKHLSLLFHGIEHRRTELISNASDENRINRLLLGLELVQRFSKRHSIPVSRVMAPPHHACSIDVCRLLLRAGYDALCVSWNSFVRWNPDFQWKDDFGLHPTELLPSGFPVIPRFNFAAREDSRVFLAALLRQPVVMLGHHWDLAGGLDILAHSAATVNRLGNVEWSDMAAVVRNSWVSRRQGQILHVRMYSRDVEIPVPAGVSSVLIDRSWLRQDGEMPVAIEVGHEPFAVRKLIPVSEDSMVVHAFPKNLLRVRSPLVQQKYLLGDERGFRLLPFARRLGCEFRDRMMPFLGGLKRK